MLTVTVGVIGVALGLLLGWRQWHVPASPPLDTLQRRRASDLMARDRTQEALLAGFRTEDVPPPDDVLRNDQRILSDALREIRHRRGAVSAVLWVLDQFSGGEVRPMAWSSALVGDAASHDRFHVDPVARSVIEWTAQEGQLGFDNGSGAPTLAVAPLEASGERGALSLHFDDGAHVTREAAREWLPPHAAMMATYYDLVRTRSDTARANFKLRGLIRTARTLQATRDPLELERTLVEDSITVVGAEWAVLVRWDEQLRQGRIRSTTPAAAALGVEPDTFVVTQDSIAGLTCIEGQVQVYGDAQALVRGADQIFGSGVQLRLVGSLVAVPVSRAEQERPIGALVCGHGTPFALGAAEARNATNLAVIAAGALETAWAVETARRNARVDPLTGLFNRRGFEERFAQVVSETDRYGGTAALIMVDIDFFKKVNDTYGHDAGDRVLVAVAGLLMDGRRTVDHAARLGGEELAVLLPQTDAAGARDLAERLRQRIEAKRVTLGVGEVRVTASFGIAVYEARVGPPGRVLEEADRALYDAKRNGRNRVEVAG